MIGIGHVPFLRSQLILNRHYSFLGSAAGHCPHIQLVQLARFAARHCLVCLSPSKVPRLVVAEPARNGVILRFAVKKTRRQTRPRDDVGCWNDSKVADWVALVVNTHASLLHRSRCAATYAESVHWLASLSRHASTLGVGFTSFKHNFSENFQIIPNNQFQFLISVSFLP